MSLVLIDKDELQETITNIFRSELKRLQSPNKPLSPAEAASFLGVSKVTLWSWEKEGKLKPSRQGRKVFYTQHQLEDFVQSRAPRKVPD